MALKYSTSKSVNYKDIDNLRESIGWRRRGIKKWKEILKKSDFVFTVWDNEKLVGMGRILEDGIMCMFYDICVHKDYHGRGIGEKIVKKLIDKVKDKKYVSIGLFTESAENFYKKFGFVKTNGMELIKHMDVLKNDSNICHSA